MYNNITQKYEGYIYIISNDINNKVYIGQTIETIEKRYKDHISASKSSNTKGVILYNAMRKYGVEHFIVKELKKISCISNIELRDKINESECYYISKYNSQKPNGYNVTPGGSNVSESIKVKIDQYDIYGKFIKTYNSTREAQQIFGNYFSRNISECCNGRCMVAYGYVWRYQGEPFNKYEVRLNDYGRKEIDCYSLDGVYLKTYKSMGIAAKELGYVTKTGKGNSSKISNCCNGTRNNAYGYVWRYKGDPFDKYNSIPKQKHTIINQYSLNNEYINTFNSIVTAANESSSNKSGIIQCCRKIYNSSNGFKWFYASDQSQPDKSKIIPNNQIDTIKEVS